MKINSKFVLISLTLRAIRNIIDLRSALLRERQKNNFSLGQNLVMQFIGFSFSLLLCFDQNRRMSTMILLTTIF